MRTRLEGKLSLNRWGTQLRAGVENIKNYTYLANASIPVKDSEENVTLFQEQCSRKTTLRQHTNIHCNVATKIKSRNFHLDGEVAYQKSSEQDILPLPELSAYGNLYMKFGLAKSTPDRNEQMCVISVNITRQTHSRHRTIL